MSALTEKVAREHRYSPGYGGCRCGLDFEATTSTYYGEWDVHAAHVGEVTEAAVRGQVAADIRALEHTAEQAAEHVRSGGAMGEVDWYDIAIGDAADVAEGSNQ